MTAALEATDEPFGWLKSRGQNNPVGWSQLRLYHMNHFRSQQSDAAVRCSQLYQGRNPAKSACILDGAEAIGKTRPILQCLKLRLRIRIIIGHMGRLWVLVTPRSASIKATGLDFIDAPRSA